MEFSPNLESTTVARRNDEYKKKKVFVASQSKARTVKNIDNGNKSTSVIVDDKKFASCTHKNR